MISLSISFFFFNDTATTEIYTLSLHDALPISAFGIPLPALAAAMHLVLPPPDSRVLAGADAVPERSEEHTSELQSQSNLVCRLLLEKKKNTFCHSTRLVSKPDITHARPLSHLI